MKTNSYRRLTSCMGTSLRNKELCFCDRPTTKRLGKVRDRREGKLQCEWSPEPIEVGDSGWIEAVESMGEDYELCDLPSLDEDYGEAERQALEEEAIAVRSLTRVLHGLESVL